MAIIPSSTRFVGIAPSVNLTEKKSNQLNSETQPYTMQDFQDSISPDLSPIVVDGNSVGIDADPTVTLQQVAVIESLTTNAGIVLKPNGTGAIMAQVPDGTATGGNARGQYAVDLQLSRTAANQVAGADYSVLAGGKNNLIPPTFNTGGVIVGGENNLLGNRTWQFIGGGQSNVALGSNTVVAGGSGNYIADAAYSTISGGQSNTASTGSHATVVGGSTNTSSGQYSVAGGYNNVASGQGAVALGRSNTASSTGSIAIGTSNTVTYQLGFAGGNGNTVSVKGTAFGGNNTVAGGEWSAAIGSSNSITSTGNSYVIGDRIGSTATYAFGTGNNSRAYLTGQRVHASGWFVLGNGDQQISDLIASKLDILSSAATTTLTLWDGSLIIPNGNNRAWNVTVKWVAVCTATGSGTTAVGDVAIATDSFMFKRVSGISSIGLVQNLQNSQDATMAGATCSYAVGGSQDLQITFTAPASANATTFRVVAKVELTECAW